MSSSWPLVPLSSVLTQDRSYIYELEDRHYPKLSVKLYGRGCVIDGFANGKDVKMKRHQLAKPGQVILSEIWGKKGAIGIVPEEGEGALVTSHFFLFDIDPTKVLTNWLLWLTKANYFENELSIKAKGSTGYAAVRPNQFLALSIPLPSLEDQRRIVKRIDYLASLVNEAKSKQECAALETKAFVAGVYGEIFGRERQRNWVDLSYYVSRLENGKSPQCEARPASVQEWGVLKVGAVSFGVFDETENKALPNHLEPQIQYEVKPGDFLMIRANTKELVGACAFVNSVRPHLLLSDKVFRFHFREGREIDLVFLDYLLKSPIVRSQIEVMATGTSPTMKNISKAKVLSIKVPSYPLEEQKRIVSVIEKLQGKVKYLYELQRRSLTEIEAVLPSVLDRAFLGPS